MSRRSRVAVIGAGLAGLAGARRLAEAGVAPVVIDKGRAAGGRLASRRSPAGRFDHGAQHLSARGPAFAAALEAAGAAEWRVGDETLGRVGTPYMRAIAEALAQGLDVRQGVEATALRRDGRGWRVETAQGAEVFDRVLCTAPAPQAARLAPEAADALSEVRFAPCWTLMLAFESPWAGAPDVARGASEAVAWAAREGARPGRAAEPERWVIQAGPGWSAQALELDPRTAAGRLLAEASAALGPPPEPVFSAAHRWRYARVEAALGQPCLAVGDGGLVVAGDGCLAPRAEAAFDSGRAGAEVLLAGL